MLVKTYKYKINPDDLETYFNIQKEADEIYKEHIDYEIIHLQDKMDPSVWLEIHNYRDEESLDIAESLADKEPRLKELYKQFFGLLEKEDVSEEVYLAFSVRK